jgi:hypothetical protein
MQVFTGSTGQMGLDVINRTNVFRQSQWHTLHISKFEEKNSNFIFWPLMGSVLFYAEGI